MKVIDSSRDEFFQKRRQRIGSPCLARELTFSCYRFLPLLNRDRTRKWFIDALKEARIKLRFDLWAYVLMPEHVHLIVRPTSDETSVAAILKEIKQPVAKRAIAYLKQHHPSWLGRLTVLESGRTRRCFWQPGGGYDRSVTEPTTLLRMFDYIHANPVRRKLVERAEDWAWPSAAWYAGQRPVPIDLDPLDPASVQKRCWYMSPHALRSAWACHPAIRPRLDF